MRATQSLRSLTRGSTSLLSRPVRTQLPRTALPNLRSTPFSTSSHLRLPSDDPGGKPNTGQHRTVYDDFFNILESPTPTTLVSISSTSPISLTLQDGLVLSEPIVILNNQVFLWDHPKLNQDYAVPSGIGWEDWLDQKITPGKKLEVTEKVKEVFKVFELVDERPEIVLFGTGKRVLPPPGPIRDWLNGLGIQVDVQSTVSISHTSQSHTVAERYTDSNNF